MAASSPAISADGRFVAFESAATNLVPGDTNGTVDVFVRDRQTGTTRAGERRARRRPGQWLQRRPGDLGGRALRRLQLGSPATWCRATPTARTTCSSATARRARPERVSVGRAAPRAMAYSFSPAISADGRFVAFESDATNLVPGDTNGAHDVFVRDRQTGTTRAGERRAGRRPGQWRQRQLRRSRRTGASSPSRRTPPTWCRATPTARATCSSATARRARPSGSSVGPGGVQGNDFSSQTRRSRRTDASSPSTRMPPTWCRATPTACTTCSSATARRARPGG